MDACDSAPSCSSRADGENSGNENAVSSTKNSEDGLDAVLTCCKCKGSVQGRSSKLLSCLHTVCAPCYIGGEFVCPLCCVKSPAKTIVENFVAHLLDANSKPQPKCNNDPCPDNAIAKFRCVQCDDILCAKCKEAHQRVKYTKDHQLVPISDARSASILSNMCEKHPNEELTLYCNKCDVLTCRDCQLSQEHSGHHEDYSFLTDAATVQQAALLGFARTADSKAGELAGQHRLAVERLAHLEQTRESCKQEVRQSANALMTQLKARVEELAQMIDGACNQRLQAYSAVKCPLEKTLEMVKQASSFAKAVAALSDKHALLRSVQFARTQTGLINALKRTYDLSVLQRQDQPMTLNLPTNLLAEEIARFGTFFTESNSVPSTSRGAAPVSAAGQILQHYIPATSMPVAVPPPPYSVASLNNVLMVNSSHQPLRKLISFASARAPVDNGGQRQRGPRARNGAPAVSQATVPPNVYVEQARGQQRMNHRRMAPYPPQMNPLQQQIHRPSCSYASLPTVPMNRHTSPPLLAPSCSPSGVSSTTVTPPFHKNQQPPCGSDNRMLLAQLQQQHQHQPALISAIPELNAAAVWAQSMNGPVSIFPAPTSIQSVLPFPHAVLMPLRQARPDLPTLVPAPMLSPRGPAPPRLERSDTYNTSSRNVPQPHHSNVAAAGACAPLVCQRPQCTQTMNTRAATNPSESVSGRTTNAACGAARSGPTDVATAIPLTAPAAVQHRYIADPTTPDVEPISPSPVDTESADVAAESAALDANPVTSAACRAVSRDSAIAGEQSSSAAVPSDPPATPVASVSSTTVDGDTAASCPEQTAPNGSATTENGTLGQRLARKSITGRLLIDSSTDASRQEGPLITPSPVQFGLMDTFNSEDPYGVDANEDNGTDNILNPRNDPGPIETPPLDTEPEVKSPGAGQVPTTDGSTSDDDVKQPDSQRSWDDYCSVCMNGGSLVCCEATGCRRVFHHDHHIPPLDETPVDAWYCTLCIDLNQFRTEMDDIPREKRKIMTEYELKVCQRILLHLYTHCESLAFHEPVDESIVEYYEVIRKPMDFSAIRKRLDPNGERPYKHVRQFVKDLNRVFKNCDTFNTDERDSQLRRAGVAVASEYARQIGEYFPDFVPAVKLRSSSRKRPASPSNDDSCTSDASVRRRRVVVHDDDDAE